MIYLHEIIDFLRMPHFIYYILLYLIILSTNFFRLKAEFKNPDTPESKFPWKRTFFVSNEIIYTGSGVYILLLGNPDWNATIMVALLFLIIISLYMVTMEDKFTDNVKFYTHLLIILIVVVGTSFTFFHPYEPKPAKQTVSLNTYRIIIPYSDNSLIKNYGYEKFGEKNFSYYQEIKATNMKAAIDSAVIIFWGDSTLRPVITSKSASNDTKREIFRINTDHIVGTKIEDNTSN